MPMTIWITVVAIAAAWPALWVEAMTAGRQ